MSATNQKLATFAKILLLSMIDSSNSERGRATPFDLKKAFEQAGMDSGIFLSTYATETCRPDCYCASLGLPQDCKRIHDDVLQSIETYAMSLQLDLDPQDLSTIVPPTMEELELANALAQELKMMC